jgi:hypothetical protein
MLINKMDNNNNIGIILLLLLGLGLCLLAITFNKKPKYEAITNEL